MTSTLAALPPCRTTVSMAPSKRRSAMKLLNLETTTAKRSPLAIRLPSNVRGILALPSDCARIQVSRAWNLRHFYDLQAVCVEAHELALALHQHTHLPDATVIQNLGADPEVSEFRARPVDIERARANRQRLPL